MIFLNVGGIGFMTSEDTLRSIHSFFTPLLNSHTDENIPIFIDRDPTYFRYILNWMRGVQVLPNDIDVLNELYVEADFYSIDSMKEYIEKKKKQASTLQHEVSKINHILERR